MISFWILCDVYFAFWGMILFISYNFVSLFSPAEKSCLSSCDSVLSRRPRNGSSFTARNWITSPTLFMYYLLFSIWVGPRFGMVAPVDSLWVTSHQALVFFKRHWLDPCIVESLVFLQCSFPIIKSMFGKNQISIINSSKFATRETKARIKLYSVFQPGSSTIPTWGWMPVQSCQNCVVGKRAAMVVWCPSQCYYQWQWPRRWRPAGHCCATDSKVFSLCCGACAT